MLLSEVWKSMLNDASRSSSSSAGSFFFRRLRSVVLRPLFSGVSSKILRLLFSGRDLVLPLDPLDDAFFPVRSHVSSLWVVGSLNLVELP